MINLRSSEDQKKGCNEEIWKRTETRDWKLCFQIFQSHNTATMRGPVDWTAPFTNAKWIFSRATRHDFITLSPLEARVIFCSNWSQLDTHIWSATIGNKAWRVHDFRDISGKKYPLIKQKIPVMQLDWSLKISFYLHNNCDTQTARLFSKFKCNIANILEQYSLLF